MMILSCIGSAYWSQAGSARPVFSLLQAPALSFLRQTDASVRPATATSAPAMSGCSDA
jgi:hypothetical protein